MIHPQIKWLILVALISASPVVRADPIILDNVLITLSQQAEVPARERGPITSISVEEGDLVQVGTVLAQIDDSEAQLAKTRAEIDVQNARSRAKSTIRLRLAEKSLELAQSELDRGLNSRKLFKNSITEEELGQRKLAVDKAKLDLEQAEEDFEVAQYQWRFSENELQIAQRNVELRVITAPISGIVVQVNRRKGEWLELGMTVGRIVRMDQLRAEGFLDANMVTSDLTGCPVRLVATIPGQGRLEFQGALRFVSPEINPVDGKIRVWAEIENRRALLRPGMRASMLIEIDKVP